MILFYSYPESNTQQQYTKVCLRFHRHHLALTGNTARSHTSSTRFLNPIDSTGFRKRKKSKKTIDTIITKFNVRITICNFRFLELLLSDDNFLFDYFFSNTTLYIISISLTQYCGHLTTTITITITITITTATATSTATATK